ncbi:hypothetical protein [Bacillus sp. SRB3LM]|uniref:hypothetical protein n=1 Tax=Bacillus sp. SRB3LM TaxID=2608689 RepID=UPI0018C3681F|nr:hypothetical protein [Bacillus sp. SRB3LM]MBG0968023.1 hypothetical protein [Bacillus sp. SRB3LM]MBG0972370.1 hypothetical protein [Bacillus sp. SRB3LM]
MTECSNRNGAKRCMYPKWIDKMAFSKAHKELLVQLYMKLITRCEYDKLVNDLYNPTQKIIAR